LNSGPHASRSSLGSILSTIVGRWIKHLLSTYCVLGTVLDTSVYYFLHSTLFSLWDSDDYYFIDKRDYLLKDGHSLSVVEISKS
jgi:hypothetical protein